MSPVTDTIAAIATAPGRGGIGVLRISGPAAANVAAALAGTPPQPRLAALRDFRDDAGTVVDRGLILYFPAPHSFTGEDVIELHGHGGPVLLQMLLQAACAAGARPARAGEFSERAFVNGKLDLTQAEAIADLIDAGSRSAVRAASRALHGEFSAQIHALVEALISLRADLEAALDFADEDVPWLSGDQLATRIQALIDAVATLRRKAGQGRRLRDGMTIVIAGRPNVGKSTLLNRLAGTEAAIVSPLAGTTRDVLREHLVLDGLPLTVLDTAGLRETDDPIEREGVRRAWAAVREAELALFVADDSTGLTADDQALLAQLPEGLPVLRVQNKCDLSGRATGLGEDDGAAVLRLSAATGVGLDALSAEICRRAGLTEGDADTFTAQARHLDALRIGAEHLDRALSWAGSHPELIAEELRLTQDALNTITGAFTTEDLLGRIFSRFCLGK